ncbi:MAG: hypothetical protein IJH84_01545 [Saccharopolyspora sp.]|uniref:GRAM domain-containing protein n=1 Tax=unclassified Saccharopolyspora TaxID=2646250 RepID=UPI0025EA4D43|nr:GRAM domain-containing protein [Saccharopolyspora sp.]MBQ6639698.1 hypothetical protein [Saccharopolyspora sp.]
MTAQLPGNVAPTDDGEIVTWRRWANRTQSNSRAAGGRLYLTNRRVLFCPHAFDANTGGEYRSIPLAAITEVGKQPRTLNLRAAYNGGLRTRLRIDCADGSTELFVLNKLDQVITEIRAATGPA